MTAVLELLLPRGGAPPCQRFPHCISHSTQRCDAPVRVSYALVGAMPRAGCLPAQPDFAKPVVTRAPHRSTWDFCSTASSPPQRFHCVAAQKQAVWCISIDHEAGTTHSTAHRCLTPLQRPDHACGQAPRLAVDARRRRRRTSPSALLDDHHHAHDVSCHETRARCTPAQRAA